MMGGFAIWDDFVGGATSNFEAIERRGLAMRVTGLRAFPGETTNLGLDTSESGGAEIIRLVGDAVGWTGETFRVVVASESGGLVMDFAKLFSLTVCFVGI